MSSSCSSLVMVKANNGGVEEREPRMVLLGVDDAISGPSVPTPSLRRKTMVPREVIDPPSALCYKS